jgi:hypothetical protein
MVVVKSITIVGVIGATPKGGTAPAAFSKQYYCEPICDAHIMFFSCWQVDIEHFGQIFALGTIGYVEGLLILSVLSHHYHHQLILQVIILGGLVILICIVYIDLTLKIVSAKRQL